MSEATHTQSADRGKTVRQKQALFWRLFGAFTQLVFLIVVAWLFSVVVEWIGLTFLWPDQGVNHSRHMFLTELTYLNDGFAERVIGFRPVTLAIWLSSSMYYWVFEWTRLVDLVEWSLIPSSGGSDFRIAWANIVQWGNTYFLSAINTTQLFGVRLAVAMLCLPAFLMVGIAALTDGIVERELRRFGAGNESSFVYHNVKSWLRPTVIGALFLYLGMPISVHPNLIFVPALILYGGTIYLTSATFKKYL